MKIILAGSDALADGIADFLLQLEWTELVGVIGSKGPVAKRAKALGIERLKPGKIKRLAADIFVAAEAPADHHHAWAESTRLGGLHVHLSLLPIHRGVDPVRWALIDGDENAGVTVHYITAEAWAGNVLAQEKIEVRDKLTGTELELHVRGTAREMIVKVLHALDKIGGLPGTPQKGEPEREHDQSPDEGLAALDLDADMAAIQRKIQTFCRPHKGARTTFGGRPLAIWRALPLLPKPLPKSSATLITAQDFSKSKDVGAVLVGPEGRRAVRCGCGGVLALRDVQVDPDEGGDVADTNEALAELFPEGSRLGD